MRWSLLIVVAACGAQAPTSTSSSTPSPSPSIAPRDVKPPTFTCGDVGVILRGHVEDEKAAGPEKEATIARACLHDKWSTSVIECVTGAAKPRPCLEQLTKDQRAAFHARLYRWSDSYPDEAVEWEDDTIDADDFVDCAVAIGDVSRYEPPLTLKGKDKELATRMRRTHVLALCEDWSTDARKCFEKEGPIDKCRALLEADQRQELTDRLAEVDALMAKVEALQKKPAAAFDCKKVVEAHYGNPRWKGKLDALKAKDRKHVITESRARMQQACVDEQWSASLRACVIVQGGEPCFTASSMTAFTWGYPASGIPVKSGIAECDAYGDVLAALTTCTAIPRQAAQQMLETHRRSMSTLSSKPADRTAAANSCKQADSAIRQSAKSLGCAI